MKDEKDPLQQIQAPPTGAAEIRRRLESQQINPLERRVLSTDEKKRVLRARAMKLARESESEQTVEESMEIVEFLLARERYGIESFYVREIYPLKELTPVPCTPPFVLGIINVRGQILSVIDIKKFFDLPQRGLTSVNKVIILHNDKMEFGILADVILGVRSITVSQIQPSLPTLTGIREQYLKGVTKEQMVILDAGKLLSDKKIVVHEEMGA